MKTTLRLLSIAALMCACRANAQELRAFWVDGFNEGIKTPQQVDTLLARLRESNCNAVFAQCRKGGDAYYLSRYDPWASDDKQHFDALADLVQKAHSGKPRLEVHVWINTCAVGRPRSNPFHIAALHPDWLALSNKGEEYDNEAIKIDPGNPGAADWTARVYLDVLRHYDVDGVHFDFVRYGGTNWGYNPKSVERFNTRYGRTGNPEPTDPQWKQWRRDQVTAIVRRVYALGNAVAPKARISAATIAWGKGPTNMEEWTEKSAPMTRTFQDWRAWMEEGIIDLNCTMTYYQEARHPDWYRLWLSWIKDHQYKRYAAPASGTWLNSMADNMRQITAIREPSAKGNRSHGVLLYSYAGTNEGPDGKEEQNPAFFTALSRTGAGTETAPFAKWVAPPVLPWKQHPTTGILYGTVVEAETMAPVDMAEVSLIRGKHAIDRQTDGTGFYAFVGVQPGKYTLRVRSRKGPAAIHKVSVIRGAHGETVLLGRSTEFVAPRDDTAVVSTTAKPRLAFRRLLVIGGTDTFPGNLIAVRADGAPSPAIRIRLAQLPVVAFQPGDIVAVAGDVARDENGEAMLGRATATLVDIRRWSDSSATCTAAALAASPARTARTVTLTATVASVSGDRMTLAGDVPTEVVLGDRKGPGVEDPVTALPAPEVGSRVKITGIATVTRRPGQPALVVVRPRTESDIVVVSTASKEKAIRLGAITAPTCFRAGRMAVR